MTKTSNTCHCGRPSRPNAYGESCESWPLCEREPIDTAVTLFSGLGASSKAARDLGLDVLPHDFMPEAVATLQANGFDAIEADVRNIDYSSPRFAGRRIRLLAGGPPCQPFSQAHAGDGQYDPRDMIPEFIRAVVELRPEVFVMEEVKTLTWAKHRPYLDKVVADLEAAGYVVDWKVLDASDFGIGQARKRLFIVGQRLDVAAPWLSHGLPGVYWPEKAPDFVRRTMAEVLGWDDDEANKRNAAVPDPRAHVSNVLWPYERPAPTVVGSFRPEVAAAPGYRVKGDPPRQGTPGSVVTTLTERLILQDMPTDWIVCGREDKRALQVGNSVPCGLIRAIFEANL